MIPKNKIMMIVIANKEYKLDDQIYIYFIFPLIIVLFD